LELAADRHGLVGGMKGGYKGRLELCQKRKSQKKNIKDASHLRVEGLRGQLRSRSWEGVKKRVGQRKWKHLGNRKNGAIPQRGRSG